MATDWLNKSKNAQPNWLGLFFGIYTHVPPSSTKDIAKPLLVY
jgi:hypothetical protein